MTTEFEAGQARRAGNSEVPLSVVIRTLDCAGTLRQVLVKLALETRDQLLVVDSGSRDESLEIARQFGASIIQIKKVDFSYGRALNYGFAQAKHDWVLVLSSHCIPAGENFLDIYRRAITRFPSNLAAAVGPLLVSKIDRKMASGITLYEREDFRSGFGIGAGNPNCLYRFSAWQQHHFDEAIPAAEDLEWYVWALNHGHSLAAVHAAAVWYASRRPLSDFFRKGRLDYRIACRLIEIPKPRLSVLLGHSAKVCLCGLLGKMTLASMIRSLTHYLGTYVEARRPWRAPGALGVGTMKGTSGNP